MGPYCKFCNRRCFTHMPADTPPEAIAAYGTSSIIATCPAGQAFEMHNFGWSYDAVMAEIGRRLDEVHANEQRSNTL